jgi:hypothetical protein
MLKIYPHGGLGGPPNFVACQSISVVVIWAVGSGGFFVLRLLLFVSSSWLVLSMLEMQVSYCFIVYCLSVLWLVPETVYFILNDPVHMQYMANMQL